MSNPDPKVGTHSFNFSPQESGGESLYLETKYYWNGDNEKDHQHNGIYLNQELTLCSYGNSATFNLCGINLDSNMLRKLADELDEEYCRALSKSEQLAKE